MDEKLIPRGPYCYRPLKYENGRLKIKPCPYHITARRRHYQENGYCSFIGKGDWEFEHFGLLWDMVKECGVKEG
jgi:hypothetical protein